MKEQILLDIIDLLKDQLQQANSRIGSLISQVEALTLQLSSLEESIRAKDNDVQKLKNKNKGLSKLLCNESEKVHPVNGTTQECLTPQTEPKAAPFNPKERGNNNAKRKEFFNIEIQEEDIYPTNPNFNPTQARLISCTDSITYHYVPGYFIKKISHLHNYSQDDTVYWAPAPKTPLFNSNFDGSFIAGILQLRYIYSIPVERIVKLFSEQGIELPKSTAHGLIAKSSELLLRLEQTLKNTVLSDHYLSIDETYYNVLVDEKNAKGKQIKKGYFWGSLANNLNLIYFMYENGSRKKEVITTYLQQYKGTIQTDAYTAYKGFESDKQYPDIIRLGCLQHCKRKFLDITDDPLAKQVVDLMNQLYQAEHEHTIGVNGWSERDNYHYRQTYAPPIFRQLKTLLLHIKNKKDLLPASPLAGAVNYALNEFEALSKYILRGDYKLDNNNSERLNRYISLSRRNSLFCASHAGAKRMALFYSLACSCRANKINTFQYFSDILNRMATISPNAPEQIYRELLPDRWKTAEK